MRAPTAIIIAIAISLGAAAQQDCFQQVGDHIIIQAEDVAINNPLWVVGNNISGYSGSGYITWTGENRFFWVGNDVLDGILRYPIDVKEAGTYLIKMYTCRTNDFECPGADKCNDVFVVAGGEMTKLYTGLGNTREVWRYTSRFDRESGHVEAYTELKAGPQEFVIAARSQGFAIDRIEITKQSSPPGLTETTKASCTYGVVQPETPCGPASSRPVPEYHINLTVTNYKPNPMAVYSYDESGAVGPETVVPVGEAASFDANIYSYWVMEEILADSTRKCSRYLYLNDYKPFRNMFPGGATPRTPVPTPVSTSLPESQSPSPSPNPEPVAPSSCGSANSIATGVSVDMQVVNWKNSPIAAYSYGVDGTETLVDSIWPGQSKTFPTSKYSYWVLKKSGLCFKNFYVAGSGAVETYKYGTKAPAASVTADPPALPATKCGSGVSTPVVGNLVTLQIVNRKSRQLKVFRADGTGALSRQVTVQPGETIEIPAEQFTYWVIRMGNRCMKSFTVYQFQGTLRRTVG